MVKQWSCAWLKHIVQSHFSGGTIVMNCHVTTTRFISHQYDSAVLSMQCDQRKIVSGTADGEIQ